MFSQPLQELYGDSFVIIASTLLPIAIDSAKHYGHERNKRIESEKQAKPSTPKRSKKAD